MNTLEVLKAAKELVKQGWCQNAFALDENREDVSCTSEDAQYHCAWGSIRAAANGKGSPTVEADAVAALAMAIGKEKSIPGGAIAAWNDHPGRNINDILEAFDLAIEQESNRVSQVD